MGLGRVLAEASPSGSLKRLIEQRFVEERSVPFLKDGDYLRVSSFAMLCPREEAICSDRKILRKSEVEPALGLIFAHGHGLHWALQNKVLPALRVIVGIWRCLDCGKTYGFYRPGKEYQFTFCRKPDNCSCGADNLLYEEIHAKNDQYRIAGHPDGFLVLPGQPGIGIIECKSIGSKGFRDIKRVPKMEHIVQAQIYMWLTGLKWAKILYWDKGGYGIDCLVEHHLEYDVETIQRVKQTALSIWRGIESGIWPDRICQTSDCPRAKECKVATPCFSSENGGT